MSKRENGWYWVRIDNEWGCVCFNGTRWQVLDERMDDIFFDEIGPRIPTPDEIEDMVIMPRSVYKFLFDQKKERDIDRTWTRGKLPENESKEG